ncbi:unnamed protein product [Triticum turgidum subsp. durum]|uniref:AB hydrolase-1 domain-containing protein n=1 Tax=Triticum turgidum subsp. durum TaxID=4567 RepID=A0A9R0WF87_TRITD|nr:unnamed protein product [Triticum turgidum subsp. durum]
MEAPADQTSSKHIVLVHGACVGGWAWFKVATRLRDAGHRVSTPDLAASGVDPRPLREVPTFFDYTKPLLDLLESLPPGEKVVLVGHSLGGVNIALACELFPEKVAAAVFLSAFMPDHRSSPAYVLEKVHLLLMNVLLDLKSSWRGERLTGWTQSLSLKILRASFLLPCSSGRWSPEQSSCSCARRRI